MYATWKQMIGDPLMPHEWPKRVRIGVNGFGATARLLLRCALLDNRGLDIVAINEPTLTPEQMIYLFKYDSHRGPFKGLVSDKIHVTFASQGHDGEYCNMEIAGRSIAVFRHKNLVDIPWDWLDVEYVLEMTGEVKHLKEATDHLTRGRARKVLVVGDTYDIPLLMYPISCRGYQRGTSVVATGSAMAHALSAVAALVDDCCEMVECMATFVLPVCGDQNLVDGFTKDPRSWRMGRAAQQNIIPGRCPSVVQSVMQALPTLRTRLDANLFHVPTFNGAVVDLTFRTAEPVSGVSEMIDKLTGSPLLEYYNQLHVNTQPFNNRPMCEQEPPPTGTMSTSPSSLTESLRNESDQSMSGSGPATVTTKGDLVPIIPMPPNLNSVVLPLAKEDAFVSSDATEKHTLAMLSVDYCLSVQTGGIVKLISWFDPGVSYCERILDTVVFMRSIDHN